MLTHQGLALGQEWRTPLAELPPAPPLPHPFSAFISHRPAVSVKMESLAMVARVLYLGTSKASEGREEEREGWR